MYESKRVKPIWICIIIAHIKNINIGTYSVSFYHLNTVKAYTNCKVYRWDNIFPRWTLVNPVCNWLLLFNRTEGPRFVHSLTINWCCLLYFNLFLQNGFFSLYYEQEANTISFRKDALFRSYRKSWKWRRRVNVRVGKMFIFIFMSIILILFKCNYVKNIGTHSPSYK